MTEQMDTDHQENNLGMSNSENYIFARFFIVFFAIVYFYIKMRSREKSVCNVKKNVCNEKSYLKKIQISNAFLYHEWTVTKKNKGREKINILLFLYTNERFILLQKK